MTFQKSESVLQESTISLFLLQNVTLCSMFENTLAISEWNLLSLLHLWIHRWKLKLV